MRDGSPLSEEILSQVFPSKFKLSTLEKYDGTSNPRSHLANFHTRMLLYNVNNFILCKIFSTMLTGLAQKWYQRLPNGSIENFEQLASSFKQTFVSCIPPRKLSSDLMKIRQAEAESLKDYVSRNNRFMVSLIKNPSVDYKYLMERAKKYIRLDDERTTLKDERHAGQSSEKRYEKRRSDRQAYSSDSRTSR
ncbi:hypothetical protein P3X46_011621 [Hevea brasiliensis]|uniref:Retrotransposon gag domain-containing protein n=1 Tax=Hevea brasiliensis TaxID=3981 RepID=A0ABQ9MBD0_HEVBR|nr:hypothetical protein P3X46_011621 [Hevea brasiliensis]